MSRALWLGLLLLPLWGEGLPPASRWVEHARDELMKYWATPVGQGVPVGNFPSTRCNDGTLYQPKTNECPEIRDNGWLKGIYEDQSVVALSRQIYGYGVAFHMTGDRRYLRWMKAGVDYFRAHYVDRAGAGAYTWWTASTRKYGPAVEARNPQELGYSLLGIGFYYYLTRDAEVLADIDWIHTQIIGSYWNPELGTLQWLLKDQPGTSAKTKNLVAVLDQMNAYMVLLTPTLPEPMSSNWKRELVGLSNIMIEQFWSEKDGLFFTGENRDLTKVSVDFGHSIKALWMIRFAGLLNGDGDLVRFAEERAQGVLRRAWLEDCGCWANGVTPAGLELNKDWWVFAELDQYSATLAMGAEGYAERLQGSYRYWLETFTDPAYGEVWTAIDGRTHKPLGGNPKAWPWKSAYHSMEHALVAYVSTAELAGEPAVLWYAFKEQAPTVEQLRPYFYTGWIAAYETELDDEFGGIERVEWRGIR